MFKISPEFTEISGRRIRYVKYGDGPPFILLHGLGRSIFQWKDHFLEFAKTNTVYAFDIPGFGCSQPLEIHERAMPFVPMFMKQFMQHFNIEKPIVLGGSFGGLAAIDYALEFPNDISKLVLMGTAGIGKEIGLGYRLLTLPVIGELWRFLDYHGIEDPDAWIDKATSVPKVGKILAEILGYILASPTKERLDNTIAENRLTPLRLFRYGFHPIFGQKKVIRRESKLHRIEVPTFVLWGEADPLFPVSHAHKAYGLLHNPYKLPLSFEGPYIFRGVGHWPPREKPKQFEAVVKEFLAS